MRHYEDRADALAYAKEAAKWEGCERVTVYAVMPGLMSDRRIFTITGEFA